MKLYVINPTEYTYSEKNIDVNRGIEDIWYKDGYIPVAYCFEHEEDAKTVCDMWKALRAETLQKEHEIHTYVTKHRYKP